MYITRLHLENFRNYARLDLDFRDGRTIFIGQNAQGKTNILEAVYLCSCARSHRTGKDRELIRQGADSYRVELDFCRRPGLTETISIAYQDENKALNLKKSREILYQGAKLEKISELFGLFHAVIFAPEDVFLVKEGPAARRRYLDLLISQIRPSYFADLQLYQHILNQRNKLLKQLRERGTRVSDAELYLSVFDEQFVACAARIVEQRQIFIEQIEAIAASALTTISEGREALKLRYHAPSGLNPRDGVERLSGQLLERLRRSLDDDLAKGSTQHGPHRDDLEMSLNDILIRPYASQGQQRSVVLALKLAELKIIEAESGTAPVLLLDDVMSELDERRRANLQLALLDHQVLLTGTDADALGATAGAALFRVHDAAVKALTGDF